VIVGGGAGVEAYPTSSRGFAQFVDR
jgi:hypothetical protein